MAAGALAAALILAGVLPGSGPASRAVAQPSGPEAVPQTDASVPARQVTMIGATPEEPEAPGGNETWGVGSEGASTVLVRYVSGGGWSLGPALPDGFKLASSQLAGTMTRDGAGVLLGTVPGEGPSRREVVLARKVGAGFEETAPVPATGETALLKEGEELFDAAESGGFGLGRAPLAAALDEAGGAAGALLVPVRAAGVEKQVLHWDGSKWTSEKIAIPEASAGEFRVLAIGASSPGNAWLLGQLASGASYPNGAVALFRRIEEGGGTFSWKPVQVGSGAGDGEAHPLTVPLQGGSSAPFTVAGTGGPPTVRAQLLTVTGEGVWVDGERSDVHAPAAPSAALYVKPEGAAGGQVLASWCALPSSATPCQHALPSSLPSAFTRSYAWTGGGPFGQRVITGLPEGVSLRLDGEQFSEVYALGGGENAGDDPGAGLGSAFSSPTEGWLGVGGLPVHLTTSPAESKLTAWPVPFRHPLLAIAPQPGAPVGALSSEALAVGERGAVARYQPSEGWLPESLFGPGERVETPRLRAVAWPTPTRAFAVGDNGAMWLWRGETRLWERDPAEPLNFRGNLLGVAFDPNNPTRGYAVGSTSVSLGGVLLRYGKSWVAETELPAQAQGAAFVSIAFAGSQAIVAYRKQVSGGEDRFIGGLIVNNGSGWQVDQEAAALLGNAAPEGVAGLPDGGAAFVTNGGPEGSRVYERESASAPWKEVPTPLPGTFRGAIALFREGGALRAIVSGGGSVGNQTEPQQPPPGAPPNFSEPLSVGGGAESGDALRQTAGGWSDEDHELNSAEPAPGGYKREDLPYRPDSLLALLVNSSGTQGWAVGGDLNEAEERLQTGTVESYGSERVGAPGTGESQVPLVRPAETGGTSAATPTYATFAVGGHAECAAPCASRSLARVGPQEWLGGAVTLAHKIGVREFFYTGPSVTAGEVTAHRSLPIPFSQEQGRAASIMAAAATAPASSANPPVEVFAALGEPDLDARPEREGTEASFNAAFTGFPQAPLIATNGTAAGCAATIGCQADYYARVSPGGPLMIVLDDASGEVGEPQLEWLEAQLAAAKAQGRAAVAIGAADLAAQVAGGDARASELVRVLVTGSRSGASCDQTSQPCNSASAYFYDAPEEDVAKPLRAGNDQIPSFGSGTLGYVNVSNEQNGNFHGASGVLLAQVQVSSREGNTNRAPVTARLIPVIGELALEARQGILLRRSEAASFAALARRPRAGCRGESVAGNGAPCEVDPYIPIPSICVGECGTALLPEYEFSSSRPDIGGFVKRNTTLVDPLAVEQQENGEPVREEADAQSGLFCAYNPGTTIVTISAGGLSASLPVTVQKGSVREPCGTVPLKELPAVQTQTTAPPPPPTQPAPANAPPAAAPPPVPLPPLPLPATAPVIVPHPVIPSFVPLATTTAPLLAFVPPPVPTPARPTPPSGTSAVTSPVEVAEKEEEEEEATESVSNQAVAYRASEHEPYGAYVIGLVLLAAFAGAAAKRRPGRKRRELSIAAATVSGARRQRQLGDERHHR